MAYLCVVCLCDLLVYVCVVACDGLCVVVWCVFIVCCCCCVVVCVWLRLWFKCGCLCVAYCVKLYGMSVAVVLFVSVYVCACFVCNVCILCVMHCVTMYGLWL